MRPSALLLGALAWMSLASASTGDAHGRRAHGHHSHFDASGRRQTGVASYYGTHGARRKTASGARFAANAMTAASRTLPLGTRARVTNVHNGRSVDVTVTDRGPFAKHRILDVSPKAAERLGMIVSGVSRVTITPLLVPKDRG